MTKIQPCRNLGEEYSRRSEEQVKDTQDGERLDVPEAHKKGSVSEVQRIPGTVVRAQGQQGNANESCRVLEAPVRGGFISIQK